MDEKQAIERATGEAFVDLYNRERGTSFRVVEHSDAPDIVTRDGDGRPLNLEIVLTEDRAGDIKAALGRSQSRSLETLCKRVEAVRAGKADALEHASELGGNVFDSLAVRLRAKMMKRYGANTALVVQDTSGVDWDWDLEAPRIQASLQDVTNPFDRGIWLLSRAKDRLFRIV